MPWLTGDSIPTEKNCRVISVPDDPVFIQAVNGALLDLTYPRNWEKQGDLTPDEQAAAFDDIYIEFSKSECMKIPVGAIMVWFEPMPPDGWLICDGSGHLKTEWPELWALYGTRYGTSPDFFGVPDFKHRSPYGATFVEELDGAAGSETHTLTTSEIPAHSHDHIRPGGAAPGAYANVAGTTATNPVNVAWPTQNTGGGQAHNNLHPVRYCWFIVYAGKHVT